MASDNVLYLKSIGSIALKCGASHFGFSTTGVFNPLHHFVIVFKDRNKRSNFLGWLYDTGMEYQKDYYTKHHYWASRRQFVYLVKINAGLIHIKGLETKVYFPNFPALCSTRRLTYYNANIQHPAYRQSKNYQQQLKKVV